MSTLFISDLHFGHKNILSYDNREFPSVEEHDEYLIRKWNEHVEIDDDVWILGDVSWHPAMKTIAILERLNGSKHLCIGNHDKKLLKNSDVRKQFAEIVHYKEIQIDKKNGVVLSHYPIPCFNLHYYGWYHLYGHVHTGFEWDMMKHVKYDMEALYDTPCNMFNVGCMVPGMDYSPKTLEEIISIFNSKGGTE